jgi:hypothetical protein
LELAPTLPHFPLRARKKNAPLTFRFPNKNQYD